MPTAIELDFYEFGVRLGQFRVLHDHYAPQTTDEMLSGDDLPLPSPEQHVLVQHSFRALERVFTAIAASLAIGETLEKLGVTLIQHCAAKWSECFGDDTTYDAQIEVANRSIHVYLERLEELLLEQVGSLLGAGANARLWAHLGLELGWGTSGSENWRFVLKLKGEEEVRDLLAGVNVGFKELCPEVNPCQLLATVLPYNPKVFLPWFQLEIGLNRLRGAVESSKPSNQLSVSENCQASGSKDVPSFLQLSVENMEVLYEGAALPEQPRQQVREALELLIEQGDTRIQTEAIRARIGIKQIAGAHRLMSYVRSFLKKSLPGLILVSELGGYRLRARVRS